VPDPSGRARTCELEDACSSLGPLSRIPVELTEVVVDVARGLVAIADVLTKAVCDDARELAGYVFAHFHQRRRSIAEDARRERGRVTPDERAFACRELVQQHPEGKEVRAVIDGRSLQLLRRHVRHRPDDGTFGSQRGGAGADVRLAVGAEQAAGRQLREPEVEYLHPAFGHDHHVGGFEIAVDDALLVRRSERVSERDADFTDPLDR
jgi:hypothetical protein